MVVANVEALQEKFRRKGVKAAHRALDMLHINTGKTNPQANPCFYLWQAMYICYQHTHAWQVVVECALQAHEDMLRAGRWSRWMDYLEMALDASRHLGDQQAEMTLLLYLGRMEEKCGEWAAAQARLQKLAGMACQASEPIACGRALTSLADLLLQVGRLDEAQEQIEQAMKTLEASQDAQALSEAYRCRGNIDQQYGKDPETLAAYTQAMKYAEMCGDLRCLASCYHNLATMCARHSDGRGAATHYHLALELFQQIEDAGGESMTLANIGLACQADRGYWRNAIETFDQARLLAEKTGYYRGEITALMYKIMTLLRLGEIEQTAAAIERLETLYTRTQSAYGAAVLEHYRAGICLAQGDAQAALLHVQRAWQSPEWVSDPDETGPAATLTGRAYARLGQWQQAEAALNQALALWASFTEWPGEMDTRLELVKLYHKMEAWDQMRAALKPARALARKIVSEDTLARLEALEGDAYFAAGDAQAGCAAYASALQALAGCGRENDRSADYHRRVLAQAQAQTNALEQTGRQAEAAALRAVWEHGM